MELNVKATKRFMIWDTHNQPVSLPYAAYGSKKISVGGRRVLLADVVNVAQNLHVVELDLIQYQEECKECANKLEFDSFLEKPFCSVKIYPIEICRACLLSCLVSAAQTNVFREQVLRAITCMLNKSVIPAFSSTKDAGGQLYGALTGSSDITCYSGGNLMPSVEALRRNRIIPLKLSQDEAATLVFGNTYEVGASSLIVGGAVNLSTALDTIAALSSEALGINTAHFDPSNFDLHRQHRGQMNSANNLHILLDGSKCVNQSLNDEEGFYDIPQVNGPVADNLAAVHKALEIELNSAKKGPILKPSEAFNMTQVRLSVQVTTAALESALDASNKRASTLLKKFPDSANSLDSAPPRRPDDGAEVSDALERAFSLLHQLRRSLALELFISILVLEALESSHSSSASGPGADDSRFTSGEGKKPKQDKATDKEANYTPEQAAKAEAKRKLKAEKAAQKAKAKEDRKGGGSSALVLGVGTSQLRKFVKAFSSSSTSAAETGTVVESLTLDKILSLVDPFDSSEKSLVHFCAKLLEQLNSGGKRRPKIPKGTRDYTPEQMSVREQVFGAIRRVFKRHGGVEIDTPVFELKEILTGKYGEDSKLIYDLADQGGELLSLRYDLTVPFARFLAMNSVGNIKRYHMAKVYRRDNPQLARGRYREFYQCDFDIAGTYNPMVPDAEVITVASEILSELPVGPFQLKLNHRRLLDAVFEICGVTADKFRPICSAVDKLDKAPWAEVRQEMVVEKGLAPEVADRIGEYVLLKGDPLELWNRLEDGRAFGEHAGAGAAMQELKTLFLYLEALGSLRFVSFDLSLARGLDYYTGVIYEAVLVEGAGDAAVQVGSVAAGGRYDNLVGMFSVSGQQTPCVGVSIGIERVFAILERKAAEKGVLQAANVQVYVASIGSGLVSERMRVAQVLWRANISAEYSHLDNPKFKKQLDEVLERGIPYMIVFGEAELANGTVKVKDIRGHVEEDVAVKDIVPALLSRGCSVVPVGADRGYLAALEDD